MTAEEARKISKENEGLLLDAQHRDVMNAITVACSRGQFFATYNYHRCLYGKVRGKLQEMGYVITDKTHEKGVSTCISWEESV